MAKKFQFRLERVLRYRDQQQRQAELRQREAYNLLIEAQQTEAEIQQEFAEASTLKGLGPHGMRPVALANALEHLGQIDLRLARAQKKVAEAQLAFERAQEERTEATKETEILKTLRSQKKSEHKRKNELEAQAAVDENVMRSWSRSKSPADDDEWNSDDRDSLP